MNETRLRFEVVVVGAGPAGLAAACAAAENGCRTALVDDTPWLGGQIWRGQQAHPANPKAARWVERFRRAKASLLDQCTVLGPADRRTLLAEHPDGPRQIEWERLILAAGARELFLPFPGWTLPGNFGPGGLQSLAKHGWPVAGKRIVLAGSGPLLLAVGGGLRKMGASIVSINEQAPLSRLISFATGLLAWPEMDVARNALPLRRLAGGGRRRGTIARRDSERRTTPMDGSMRFAGVRLWAGSQCRIAAGLGLSIRR